MGNDCHVILFKRSCASASINADSLQYTPHVHWSSLNKEHVEAVRRQIPQVTSHEDQELNE